VSARGLSIRAAAEVAPHRVALDLPARNVAFAALETHARRAAHGLAASGSRVIAFTPRPTLESLATIYAALELGRSFALLHPRWSADERVHALSTLGDVRHVDETELCGLSEGPLPDAWPTPSPDLGEALVFTSGTTGAPRAARIGFDALAAAARAHESALPFEPDDAWLLAMPLSHVGGLSILTRCLTARARVICLERFEAGAFLAAVRERSATLASVVPSMLSVMLDHAQSRELARLRFALVGGAAYAPLLRARAHEIGITTLATYGMTETAAQVATQRLDPTRAPTSSDSGMPLPGVLLEIVDDDGALLPAGKAGRIRVSGPTLFRGYVGEVSRALGAPFVTGDEGYFDERGALHVLGRADDVIVTGGENVHPLEVEVELAAEEGVLGALVFGVPNETWGEIVATALVLGTGVDPLGVLERAASRLAAFKKPRRYVVVASLPLTPNGKPDRKRAGRDLAARLETVVTRRA